MKVEYYNWKHEAEVNKLFDELGLEHCTPRECSEDEFWGMCRRLFMECGFSLNIRNGAREEGVVTIGVMKKGGRW